LARKLVANNFRIPSGVWFPILGNYSTKKRFFIKRITYD